MATTTAHRQSSSSSSSSSSSPPPHVRCPFDFCREYFATRRQLNDHIDRAHRICTEQLDTMNKARGVEHSTATVRSSSSKTGVYAPIEVWGKASLDKEPEDANENENEKALALISAVLRCWTKESLGRDLPMALAGAGDDEEETERPSGSASSSS